MRVAPGLAVLVLAASAAALEVPPPPSERMADWANVVDGEGEDEIEARLAAIERDTGHQAVVATFPSLEGESMEDFTIRCAERWKVGRRGLDDGVIFFVFVAERRMRLEVGYGLEDRIPDARAAHLLDLAKPGFRQGDYRAGIGAVVSGLEALFRGDPLPEATDRPGADALVDIAVFVLVLLLLPLLLGRTRRGRGGYLGGFGGDRGGFGGFSGGGFGGFSGGGGGFGGGGASGGW